MVYPLDDVLVLCAIEVLFLHRFFLIAVRIQDLIQYLLLSILLVVLQIPDSQTPNLAVQLPPFPSKIHVHLVIATDQIDFDLGHQIFLQILF